jgi:hypothetical protein
MGEKPVFRAFRGGLTCMVSTKIAGILIDNHDLILSWKTRNLQERRSE